MKPPRRLNAHEAALWARVAHTVKPLDGRASPPLPPPEQPPAGRAGRHVAPAARPLAKSTRDTPAHGALAHGQPAGGGGIDIARHGLDGGWERKLARGIVAPDFTIDLHGCTLDQAHSRLDHGLAQALAMGARVLLLITGRERNPGDHGGRSERRGAIRAKFRDWLDAGRHASRIAAIRPAHPRHGGGGAVYVVLRRTR